MISNDSNSFQKGTYSLHVLGSKTPSNLGKSSIPFALPDAICWINPITIFVYSLLLPNKSGMDHDFFSTYFYFLYSSNPPFMPDSLSCIPSAILPVWLSVSFFQKIERKIFGNGENPRFCVGTLPIAGNVLCDLDEDLLPDVLSEILVLEIGVSNQKDGFFHFSVNLVEPRIRPLQSLYVPL